MTVAAAITPTVEAQAPAAASSSAPAGPPDTNGSAPAEAGTSKPGPSTTSVPETSSVPAADEGILLKVSFLVSAKLYVECQHSVLVELLHTCGSWLLLGAKTSIILDNTYFSLQTHQPCQTAVNYARHLS